MVQDSIGASKMDSSGRVSGLGMGLLNQSNYRVLRTGLESHPIGEYLWDIVNGGNIIVLDNKLENSEDFKT